MLDYRYWYVVREYGLHAPVICVLLFLSVIANSMQVDAGVLSADFNADGFVLQDDYTTFLQNYGLSGPPAAFSTGDANGDQHVRLFCDIVPIIEQFGSGLPAGPLTSGSTSVPTATYNPATGTIAIDPNAMNGQAITALYLVNTAGGPLAGVSGPTALFELEVNNGVFPVPGFAAGSTSIVTQRLTPGMDLLGAAGQSIVYSAPTNTAVSDLQLFFQRAGQAPLPVTITDTVSQLTHTATGEPCHCVPEPASLCAFGIGSLCLLRRRQ